MPEITKFPGDSLRVYDSVKNVGNKSFRLGIRQKLEGPGITVVSPQKDYGILDPNASVSIDQSFTIPDDTPAGTYTHSLYIDSIDQNETIKEHPTGWTVTIQEKTVNAQITNFDAPTSIDYCQTSTANVTIKNTGNVSHTFGVTLDYWDPDGILHSITSKSITLDPNQEGTVSFLLLECQTCGQTHCFNKNGVWHGKARVWKESSEPYSNILDESDIYTDVLGKTAVFSYGWVYDLESIPFFVYDYNTTLEPPPIPPEESSSPNAPSLTLYDPSYPRLFSVCINGVTIPASGRSVTKIHWDWGDGTTEDAWFPAGHTYSKAGYYIVTVTTYDNYGDWRQKSVRVLIGPEDKKPLEGVKIECSDLGLSGYTDSGGFLKFGGVCFPAGTYTFTISKSGYRSETWTVDIYAHPNLENSDVDNITCPGTKTIDFGYFDPPVPVSASDEEKMNANVTYSRWIDLNDFPEWYEMVRLDTCWTNVVQDLEFRVRWYYDPTGEKLFEWSWSNTPGYSSLCLRAWIGHLPCGEIFRTGLYKVILDFPNPKGGFSGSYTLYFYVYE